IQHVIRWVALTGRLGAPVSSVLKEILETPISPELVPGEVPGADPTPYTENIIGPYELQYFNLYFTLRFCYAPAKIAFLAYCARHDRSRGAWPEIPAELRHEYGVGAIKANLRIFVRRFFELSQFKRSTIPNAPKVGSGGSLSPRGDWR